LANDYEEDEELREDLAAVHAAGGAAILDDLDRLVTEVPPPFLNALANAWSSGDPNLLTIASHETRTRLETWMPGLRDSLDPLVLEPLDSTTAHAAFKAGVGRVLERHGIALAADAHPAELSRLADRFLTGLAMPGRALDLLDLACARSVREGRHEVSLDTVIGIVCERTGLPRDRVTGSSDRDLLDLDQQLSRLIVGHEPAISTLCQLVRRNRAGFSSDRPIATTLLLGPSGVGKTEIAKAMAASLFESGPEALLRLDMSEYAESHAVARVVGAPPGYVGHEQGGALTDPLLRQPHRVILLDEIEKAHRDVHQLLLQVFDEGRLTDGRGRTVDFRHAVIVMTSNLGATLLSDGDAHEQEVLHAARAAFPVELWNRIEAPLVLQPLSADSMIRICRRLAATSSERLLAERGIQYELDDSASEYLVELAGEDPALGARPLRHLLSREVESFVADAILRGHFRAGNRIKVSYEDELTLTLVGRR
jgi:ATP-dependent Clp protease ATP-binding subunit ClpC